MYFHSKKSINVADKYLIFNGLKERRHVMLQFLFMTNIETVANPTDERDCKRDFNWLSKQGWYITINNGAFRYQFL